jgi:hypothetical protein
MVQAGKYVQCDNEHVAITFQRHFKKDNSIIFQYGIMLKYTAKYRTDNL